MRSLILTISESNRYTVLINSLLIFLFLYSYSIKLSSGLVQFALLFSLFILFFFDSGYKRKIVPWILILLLLVIDLFQDYFMAANHHFVLIYICAVVTIACIFKKDFNNIIQVNFRKIIILILSFAIVHKLFSNEFMDGSYLTFLGLDGSLFKPFRQFDFYDNLIVENHQIIKTINSQNPQNYPSKSLNIPFLSYSSIMILFTYITIVIEFLLAFILLCNRQKLFNYLFSIFLLFLLLTRNETGFIAVMSILGIGQLTDKCDKFKISYYFIFITSLILMLTKNGYF